MGGLNSSMPLLAQVNGGTLPGIAGDLAEAFRIVAEDDATKRYNESDAFGIGVAPSISPYWIAGRIIAEVVRLHPAQTPAITYTWTVAEQLFMADGLRLAIPALASDAIHVQPALSTAIAVKVLQGLGIAETPLPTLKYTQALLQGITVSDALRRFFGGQLAESIGLTEALAEKFIAHPEIDESIHIAPALSNQLILGVSIDDTIDISDEDIEKMLFSGEALADGIQVVTAYVSPDGQFTTWAMNTRTAAVTEYSNYAFNSFAPIGDTYYGASSTGLYRLLGDNDDGTSIIAELKSGFAQWGGSQFALFKRAYLGVRGEGEFVLKLITGDGNTYVYQTSTRNQRTTKVHLGKGLRARYWAFDLISTGQDFDLDTIEFVPLIADRRV